MLKNSVKEIRLYKRGILYNEHHNNHYKLKKYLEIEFFSGKIIQLDIRGKADITECEYLEIAKKGKLVKVLFKHELA